MRVLRRLTQNSHFLTTSHQDYSLTPQHLKTSSKRNSFIKDIFNTFQIPLDSILQNKLLILKNYNGFTENDLDNQVYFLFEQYIVLINKFIEDENKKNREEESKKGENNKSNYNPSKFMNGFKSVSSILGKFKK